MPVPIDTAPFSAFVCSIHAFKQQQRENTATMPTEDCGGSGWLRGQLKREDIAPFFHLTAVEAAGKLGRR